MIAQFEQLGNIVEAQWEKAGRTESSFAEIATTALADSRVLTTIEPRDIVTWLMKGHDVPGQNASDFGQPPINVYVSNGFYIQVLFWLDSTTAIHEHSFSGAFGVLSGSSVQSTYSFETEQAPSERLIVGHTRFLSSELLYRGVPARPDTRERPFAHRRKLKIASWNYSLKCHWRRPRTR